MQINPRAGLTFATALRSILRSDPDVIMVGEIRDVETAKISIEAALTGHFVLSTLHTNDAPSALTRLTEMGVEPFLTASAVSAVLAQRLVRKLCSHCAEPYQPSEAELRAARVPEHELAGLHGELGVPPRGGLRPLREHRLQGPHRRLPAAADDRASSSARRAGRAATRSSSSAYEAGMRTLWDDGIDKVAAGLTTVEELARVCV